MMKKEADVPIWLVGFSRGCFSAIYGCLQVKDGIEGIAILGCPTVYPKKAKIHKTHPNAILNMELSKVSVPVQIIYHEKDACKWCPPTNANKIKGALVNSTSVDLKYLSGGKSPKQIVKLDLHIVSMGLRRNLLHLSPDLLVYQPCRGQIHHRQLY